MKNFINKIKKYIYGHTYKSEDPRHPANWNELYEIPKNKLLSYIMHHRQSGLELLSNIGRPIDEFKEEILKMEEKKLFFNFKEKIQNNINNNKFSIIAEMKRMSPSAGIIIPANKYDPVNIAKIYNDNNATCLSVLTEPKFFGGDLYHMKLIKEHGVKLPILCKDFMITIWQLYCSRFMGADAILIILAAYEENDEFIDKLYDEAIKLNMSIIVEVHTIEEAKRALKFKKALIGINNRNLDTLKVDINTTNNIYTVLKDHPMPLISESGIKTKEELLDINKKTKIKTFLIGESLLKNLDKNSIFTIL